jgi:glycosyltransferase involved in cell wall biosynthesis
MHIAFNGWFWDQPYTGSGQYIRALVPTLHTLDSSLKLTLIVPDHVTFDRDLPPEVEVIRAKVPMRGQVGKVWFEQQTYPGLVSKVRADIAHIPYWGAPLSASARIVVTIHDVIPLSMPIYQEGWGAKLYTGLAIAGAKGALHILTDSLFSRTEIIAQLGVSPDSVTAIPLAVGPEYHPRLGADRDSEIREKYHLPDDYALYLGGFDIRKNVRALLAAYTYVGPSAGEDYPLVLAGQEPAHWGTPRFPDLRDEIEKSGVGKWVRWIGPVDEADKPGVYRMARVHVFPSRYEGFGLPPLESMACGTATIAADAASLPEVVGDGAYLVDPDDSRAMGGAIIATLIQDDLHASLRNHGLARASQFSWTRTARETLAVYQKVMRV